MEKENEEKVSETKVNETKVETKEKVKKENKKDNQNNKALIVLAIILSILVLGLGGFIVYDKVLSDKPIDNKDNNNGNNNNDNKTDNDDKQDDNTKNDNKTDDKNTGGTTNTDCPTGNQYKYNVSKRKYIQVIDSYDPLSVVVDTNGEAFVTVFGNPEDIGNNIDDVDKKNNLIKFVKTFKDYYPKGYTTPGPGPYSLSSYKLNIKNVLTAYFVDYGNGIANCFIFLKEDGTLSYFFVSEIMATGNIDVKDVNGLKNVVSIPRNRGGSGLYAITLDGEEVELYDYIKN